MKPWPFVTEASLNGIFARSAGQYGSPYQPRAIYIVLLAESLST
jgi:hypothetical protein